jgi:hypothetical protein
MAIAVLASPFSSIGSVVSFVAMSSVSVSRLLMSTPSMSADSLGFVLKYAKPAEECPQPQTDRSLTI